MVREQAPAKINLVLRVGPRAANGLHELCSLFASLELADELEVEPAPADSVECEGVEGPHLAAAAGGAPASVRATRPAAARADRQAHSGRGRAGRWQRGRGGGDAG